jgi:hypothetical protein
MNIAYLLIRAQSSKEAASDCVWFITKPGLAARSQRERQAGKWPALECARRLLAGKEPRNVENVEDVDEF